MDIIDGGYIDTNWVIDSTKPFTIAITHRDDGYGGFANFYSGVTETDSLWVGRTRNTTYSNFGFWVKDEGVNSINTNAEYSPSVTVHTVFSYDPDTKAIKWRNNKGSIRNVTLTDGLDTFTLPFFLGAINDNGTASTNRVAVGDFVVYPKFFTSEDFTLEYNMFVQKWNLDTFTKRTDNTMTYKEMIEYVYNSGVVFDKHDYIQHKKDYLQTRLFSADRVAVIGDSITHGAYTTDFQNRRWASRLKNYINTLNDSRNYGFENVYYYNNDFTSNQYHKVSYVITENNWTVKSETSSGLSGYEKYSSTLGEGLIFTIDDLKDQTKFRVYGINEISTAGSYEVYVNDVLVGTETIVSNSERLTQISNLYSLSDVGSNNCVVKVVITSGSVGFQGVEYMATENDKLINVYAQAGRKTRDVNLNSVQHICKNNDVIFWCLGYNDQGLTGTDWDKIEAVLNELQMQAAINNNFVVFCDFLWRANLQLNLRVKMNEVSEALGYKSLYLNLAQSLTEDAKIETSTTYLTTDLSSWTDTAHPNDKGHSVLFNIIRNSIGL